MTPLLGWLACADLDGAGIGGRVGARGAEDSASEGETGLSIDQDRPWPLPCRLVLETWDAPTDGVPDLYYPHVWQVTRDGWIHQRFSTDDLALPGEVAGGQEIYDLQGNLLHGGTAGPTWSYDDSGRLWRHQDYHRNSDPSRNYIQTYTYSDLGLLTYTYMDTEGPYDYWDRWEYDLWGRVLVYEHSGSSSGAEPARETYRYDGRGNLVELLKEQTPFPFEDQLWQWGYDAEDRRLWELFTTNAGSSWRWYENDGLQITEYDFVGMTTDLVGVTTTTYDEDGNRVSYVWDNRSYLAELADPGVDTILEWTYDEYGNMTSESSIDREDGSVRTRAAWVYECH